MKKVTVNRYNLKNQMEKTEFNQDCGRKHMNNIILNRNAGSPYCQTSGENCPRQDIHRAERRFKINKNEI